ncbi:GGDEF domain-containing protein, diguanylate cyclase (c-di-GMP synthetase) or its enzymatically inactive variants [Pseudomonas frederiksbergensis]|uniref:GGDEF domain-containing protein, diguanylate cyclase (C-di-GMP synthetase) or its enzymatically inactive variants n=1 Tax=Pseudomonas frederiksbergensis TaxID=104087 RepID=A0A1H5AJL5_9PSED|nr:diguanylate cyclase [Pseudomonas frederiksbergensis]SED42606.1 GGDEF domain-containing protein, diguanylate cyclase (c-di-GMP synthetase) or its enzymatically inactive variants [Pseudomonas frederiksbergensis]
MPSPIPRIAILGIRAPSLNSPELEHFADIASLLAAPAFDVVLLDLPAAYAGRVLRKLRTIPPYRYSLIYCCRDQNGWCEALGDGACPVDSSEIRALWGVWRERYKLFVQGSATERFESRVLSWLWLRDNAHIYALRDPEVPQHYRYPLLDALADSEQINPFVWLSLMVQQDWLEEGVLVDRVRLCSECGSGRLNYIDVCAECQALDISRQPSLHCFTCGHVGPQENFLKDGVLLCPNCLNRLRHIGSDYDRPMENYRCRSCQAFFVDADVQARCLDCGLSHTPDKLRVREVRDFRLAEAGRFRCRQEFSDQSVRHFGRLNLLGGKDFYDLLTWQIQVVRRYPVPAFSVLGLRFVNLASTLSRLGEHHGHAFIDSVAERLKETVRDTDRCSRSTEEYFWIMLPHTDDTGLETVKQRLSRVAELFSAPEVSDISLRVVSITAPQDLLEQEDGELLLARLASELA